MSKQIAVRLPDELVDFIDDLVRTGQGKSRAAVVVRALERERRRAVAERDAQILAVVGDDPELAGLAEYVAGLPLEID
jgi:Arc/MetJ-type ribon-helix-helix transcriptional regulator